MIFIKLEIVQFIESSTCLSVGPIGQVESLIANPVLATNLNAQQSLLLTDLLCLQQLGLEKSKKLIFVVWLEDWDAID